MELLRDLQQRLGMALIMISHDLGLAASFADEVMVMYAGRGGRARARRASCSRRCGCPTRARCSTRSRGWRTRRTRRWPPCPGSRRTWPARAGRAARSRRAARASPTKCREHAPAVRGAGARPPVGVLASLRTERAAVSERAAARGLATSSRSSPCATAGGVKARHRARRLRRLVRRWPRERRSGWSGRPARGSRRWRGRSCRRRRRSPARCGCAGTELVGLKRAQAARGAPPACRWSSRTRSARSIRSGGCVDLVEEPLVGVQGRHARERPAQASGRAARSGRPRSRALSDRAGRASSPGGRPSGWRSPARWRSTRR